MTALNKQAELRKELSNPAIGSNHHLRKLALSLLDELEAKDKLIDTLRQDKDKVIDMSIERVNKLLSRSEAAEKRNAELEARTVTLPDRKSIQFWPGDASEFDCLGYEIAVENAIRAAGIGVKGE